MSQKAEDLEKKLDTHLGVLPEKKLLIVVWALFLGAVLAMADTVGISVAIPYIAKDLNASKTIQWVPTVFSISNSIFTILSGRFADIFGRRNLIVMCFFITGIFQLAQGLAQTGPQFYIFRAISGLGCGGIIPLSMVIIADNVEPDRRASYQGLFGSGIGLGACLGYFLFGGFSASTAKSWRNGFYLLCPATISTGLIVGWIVPQSKSNLSKKEILHNIDYFGVVVASAFLVFILIPLNCGGILYEWSSTIIIVFLVLAGCSLIAFALIEKFVANLPIVPVKLFKNLPVINLLFQCILYGAVYFSVCFYFPYYFMVVRDMNMMQTSGMMQCILLPLCINSNISGRLISKFGNYNYVIWTGYTLWVLSNLLLLILKESTNLWGLGFILIVMGISIGWTFQPTQQALQGQSDIKDRSIIMGLRNALRYIGNAIGIAVSSLIFTSTITHHAESSDILNSQEKLFIVDNMSVKYDLHTLTPDPVKIKEIKHIYLLAIKNLIYLWIPLIGMCWILSFLIKDKGLRSKDEQIAQIEDTEMSGDVQLVSVSGKDTARI
jgi:MFS family permease